jgi:GGDEF domain-containing protein
MESFDQCCERLGHTRGHEILTAIGTYLTKHFGAVGGFLARHSENQFATFLPFSNLGEAERILKGFAVDLQQEGLRTIQAEAHISPEMCFEFAILAGLAEGKAGGGEMDSVLKEAEARQQEIARVRCEVRR